MSDITTSWDVQNGRGDWVVQNGQLLSGNDLETAVLISLFTDRRAQPSDVIPDGTDDPRGWWADTDLNGNRDEWGSRLWLIDRRTAPTNKTRIEAAGYCKEALQWLITDGVAAKIDVRAEWNDTNFLAILVTIFKVDDKTPVSLKYNILWSEIK